MKAEKEMEAVVPAAKKKAASNDPVFELALANYPDFVIRRSTAKTEKLLVIMPSQNSYYIKTVKNGQENKDVLTRQNYGAFTSGMETITLDGFWIDEVEPGVTFYDNLMLLLGKEPIRKAIVGRYYRKIDFNSRHLISTAADMYEAIPNILKAFPEKDFSCEWQSLRHISEKFGLENTKELIAEREKTLVTDDLESYILPELLSEYEFKFSSFKDYLLYDAVRMGWADNIYGFFTEWKDTLDMQIRLYGKIKEKYPRHLSELHNQLAYKLRLMKKEIDERNFAKRTVEAIKFEATIGDYVFIAPKQPQDFYDEATAQNNCLAGYVEKYTDGKDYIIFMRKKDTPEVSLVTIELDLDGRVIQAYQSRNTLITMEQQSIINAWLAKVVQPAMLETKVA